MSKEERVNEVLKQLAKRKYLVVANHDSGVYSFNELLNKFGLELQTKDGQIGFWEIDYDDWYIKPITANPRKWKNIMNELLNTILGTNRGALAVACITNNDFVATVF